MGLTHWWWVGLAVLLPLALWGWRGLKEVKPKALVEAELVGLAAFLRLAFLRLSAMAVTATEKPMDLAILATLLRPGTIPPGDPWLAGQSLPYYYFGFVPWLLPAKLLGFAPDVVFNLLLPTLAAVSAQGAWALARAVGGSRRTGVMAAFLVVFAGTFGGWRQLFAGTPLSGLDLWPSSRAIQGTITEFPLFTFHLGDLHPHLLCLPFVLVAIFLGRVLGTVKRPLVAHDRALLGPLRSGRGLQPLVRDSPGAGDPAGGGRRRGWLCPPGWSRALALGAGGRARCYRLDSLSAFLAELSSADPRVRLGHHRDTG